MKHSLLTLLTAQLYDFVDPLSNLDTDITVIAAKGIVDRLSPLP